MADDQVHRVSNSLRECANSIQGINSKFDEVDEHWRRMQEFNNKVNNRVEVMLDSFKRMDDTFATRGENILETMMVLTDELSHSLEATLQALNRFDIRRDTVQFTKVIIPMTLPLVVLLVELGVSNAYLGILLASLPEVKSQYSSYLLANATFILLGLTVSLLWLGGYRIWLSFKARSLEVSEDEGEMENHSFHGRRMSPNDDTETLTAKENSFDRGMGTPPLAVQLSRADSTRLRHELYFNGDEVSSSSAGSQHEVSSHDAERQSSGHSGHSDDRPPKGSHSNASSTLSSGPSAQLYRDRSRSENMNRIERMKSGDMSSALRRVRHARTGLARSDSRGDAMKRYESNASVVPGEHDDADESKGTRFRLRSMKTRGRRNSESIEADRTTKLSRRLRQTSPDAPTLAPIASQEELDEAAVPVPRSDSNSETRSEPRRGGLKPYLQGINPFAVDVQWRKDKKQQR